MSYDPENSLTKPAAIVMLAYIYLEADAEPYQVQTLKHYLEVLRQQGIVTRLYHRIIVPEHRLPKSIDRTLESAQTIVLLASQRFVNSRYCQESEEIKHAIAQHQAGEIYFIPVILDSVDRSGTAFFDLDKIPENGSVITLVNQLGSFNEAYKRVAQEIKGKLYQRRVTQLADRVDELERLSNQLTDQVHQQDEQMQQLNNQNEGLNQLINQLNSQLSQQEQTINQLTTERNQLSNQIDQFKEEENQLVHTNQQLSELNGALMADNQNFKVVNRWLQGFSLVGFIAAIVILAWDLWRPPLSPRSTPAPNATGVMQRSR